MLTDDVPDQYLGKDHSAAIGYWSTPFLARAYRPGQELLKRPGARYAEPLPAGSVARRELYEARRPALAGPP
jgi:hypothetical protein